MSTQMSQPTLVGFRSRSDISAEMVQFASDFIERTGMVAHIEQTRGACATKGGRPAHLSDHAVLTLMFLLALESRPLHLRRMAEMVEHRLSDQSLDALDIKRDWPSSDNLYKRVVRAFGRVVDAVDPFPGPRRKRLTTAEFEGLCESRDQSVVDAMNEDLHDMCNLPVTTSVSYMPKQARDAFVGNYALDGTLVKAGGSRGTDYFSGKYVNIESDAGRYYREGNHGGDDKKRRKEKNCWGYEMQVVAMVRNHPGAPDLFPLLTTGIAFDAPAKSPGLNGLRAVRPAVEAGLPVLHMMADRAYYAGAKVENFHVQMDEWGFRPVTDYIRPSQLGVQASHAGAILVEGTWYCPTMPQDLIDATARHEQKDTTPAEYQAELKARSRYAAVLKARSNSDGVTRWAHPEGIGHLCDPDRKHAGAFCTQKSVSMPREAGLKTRQEFAFNTPEWKAMYALRNTVESMNATLKESGEQCLDEAGRRRVRGRTAQFLACSLMVAAANIRKIERWSEADHELAAKRRERRPRVPYRFSTMDDDERAAAEVELDPVA